MAEENVNMNGNDGNLSKSARNKQLKKERKLVITFMKKTLKIDNEELNYCPQNCRNLLIDNRDYQVFKSTEELYRLYGNNGKDSISDIYVLPTKTWFIISFPDSDSCQSFIAQKRNQIEKECGINQFAFVDDVLLVKAIEIFSSETKKIAQQFEDLPKGSKLIENFVPVEDIQMLMENISALFADNCNTAKLCKLRNRQALHFGHVFDYTENTISSGSGIQIVDHRFPSYVERLVSKLVDKEIIPERPDQLTINRYSLQDGDHIPAHVDTHSMCTDWILSVSIGSDVVMNFSDPRISPDYDDSGTQSIEDSGDSGTTIKALSCVHLKSGSALLLRDESRYLLRHCIAQTSQDLIFTDGKLALSPRGLRFSLTFRKTTEKGYKCQCRFPLMCDSQQPADKNPQSRPEMESITDSTSALALETEYVHRIYDDIATHFSSTRYGCWAKVVEFLDSLPSGSMVVDVGCGNGKYLSSNKNLVMLGSDRSANLLTICKERQFEIFQDDCIQIGRTLREGVFDGAISIAVIHHLATEERRLSAVEAILRLLRIGGQALISVWAFEQKRDETGSKYLKKNQNTSSTLVADGNEDGNATNDSNDCQLPVHKNRTEFQKQDLFVPWTKSKADNGKKDVKMRFYHVFREGELESLVKKTDAEIVRIYYDQGNWCVILKRVQ